MRLRTSGATLVTPKKAKLFVTLATGHTRTRGETVFHDAPLRMRNLIDVDPHLPAFDEVAPANDGFKIRVARLPGRRLESGKLVHKRYAGRGYLFPPPVSDAAEPHLSTFLAYDEGKLVGTVSVRLDSSRHLVADQLFPGELARLRRQGWRLCEFTRLAVDATAASKSVLASLFHTAFLYAARLQGFTHAVIEVNPRHVGFYQRAFGFYVIGSERFSERVNAPSVLLAVPFTNIADGLRRFAGHRNAPGAARTLMRYGFSPEDEMGVLRRLRESSPSSEARAGS